LGERTEQSYPSRRNMSFVREGKREPRANRKKEHAPTTDKAILKKLTRKGPGVKRPLPNSGRRWEIADKFDVKKEFSL